MNTSEQKEKKQVQDWAGLLHKAKEAIVKALWGLSGVKEGERELVLKEILWELQQLQDKVQEESQRVESKERLFAEENELLRSLLGTGENELRARVLALAQEIHGVRQDLITSQDELQALRKKAAEYAESNDDLRQALKEAQQIIDDLQAQKTAGWQSQMSGFSAEQAALQEQLARLNGQVGQVQNLLANQGDELTREKHSELAALQARLFKQMEQALEQKEDLIWAEEELFARGVAQKLRGELQAATGRLQLTLDKFHLLDDKTGPRPKTWEQWWRLLKVGPDELSRSFGEVGEDLRRAVGTLEEYLTLTHRRAPRSEDVVIPDVVRAQAAKLYADRLEKGALEIIVPDVLPVVKGDEEFLSVALKAMLDNAFEALPRSGGRVRLEAATSPDGREVWVSVSDSGPGVAPGQTEHLFQPFFTTKEGHRGLGLARARRYAEWHRGGLELVESGPQGAMFRLRLPL